MNPQSSPRNTNSLANWVNDAPNLQESALRYDKIVDGSVHEAPATSVIQAAFRSH